MRAQAWVAVRATVRTHVCLPGSHVTGGTRPEPICEECGNPRSHTVHAVADVADGFDDRKIGEGKEADDANV
jgi:hypothetical protein